MKVPLLSKLTVDKDRRNFTPEPITEGRIRLMRARYSASSSELMKVNLIFMLFLLPLAVCLLFLPGYYEGITLSNFNFSGSLGIGFPGNNDSLEVCKTLLYQKYFYVVCIAAACVWFAGTASSGVFYCVRNAYWESTIRPFKDFFKGIGLFALPFGIIFLIIAGLIIGDGALILWLAKNIATSTANAGMWIAVILSLLVTFYILMNIVIMLPMLSAYRFKFKDVIKNSFILTVTVWPFAIIITALIVGFFILPFTGMLWKLLVYMAMMIGGGTYIAMIITAFAHYSFDLTINPLYEQMNKPQVNGKSKNKKNKK